jgi:hypothetical protein
MPIVVTSKLQRNDGGDMNSIIVKRERVSEFHNCLEKDEKQVVLLGVSKKTLVKVFGEPSVTFVYQGKEVLHYGQPGLSFVEVVDGLVRRCETLPEQRAAFRVQPLHPTSVRIDTRCGKLSGVISDISVSGVAITYSRNHFFTAQEEVTLRFDLPSREGKHTISVPAAFYRMSYDRINGQNTRKAIFLLDTASEAGLDNALTGYVSRRQVEMLAEYREKCMCVNC